MKIITLDASNWRVWHDFYDDVLPALGAPAYHGKNMNALVESMVWGEINDIEAPYKLCIKSTRNLHPDLIAKLNALKGHLADARSDFKLAQGQDIDVSIEIES